MTNDNSRRTTAQVVEEYNCDVFQTLTKAVTYGNMVRPRSTLAELAGLASNDNQAKGE